MAYGCVMNLKEECDGCGRCGEDDEHPMAYGRPFSKKPYYGALSDWDNDPVNDPMDREW